MSQPDYSNHHVGSLPVLIIFLVLFSSLTESQGKPPYNGSIFGKRSDSSINVHEGAKRSSKNMENPTENQSSAASSESPGNSLMNLISRQSMLNRAALFKCLELQDEQASTGIALLCSKLIADGERRALLHDWLSHLLSAAELESPSRPNVVTN